jgi:hypothetical protein
VFEELVDLHAIQGQVKGSDIIQTLQYNLQKHSLELYTILDIHVVTDGVGARGSVVG